MLYKLLVAIYKYLFIGTIDEMEGIALGNLGMTRELSTLVGPGFTAHIGDMNKSFDVGDGRLSKVLSLS